MKHIKIFEDFSRRGMGQRPGFGGATKYLIGYFATGGYGSHPAVVTEEELESNGWSESIPGSGSWGNAKHLMFQALTESTEIPQALLCIYDNDREWKIDPISSQLAKSIYNAGGAEDYYVGARGFKEAKNMVDVNGWNNIEILSVLPNVEVNTIYWSDNPEKSHGYWKANGARPMTVEEFTEKN